VYFTQALLREEVITYGHVIHEQSPPQQKVLQSKLKNWEVWASVGLLSLILVYLGLFQGEELR
jgi:hypothetical protein